ncbi:Subtilisin-like serine protease [Candidatus Tiddalikarchaeum anstoanum]|nr:Subtilisin-like serine protease [Candidatus Tiddalikarchaeum anstoanum]
MLLETKLITFICLFIICLFFVEPVFAINQSSNSSEDISHQTNFTYINGTCQNTTLFNLTQQNETLIEINPCLNISCQEGFQCVQGKCILNLSYRNVDFNIIYGLSFNKWVNVIVNLYDESSFVFSSNLALNRELYTQRAGYFYKTEDEVLSTIPEGEFILRHTFGLANSFSGLITLEGLMYLQNNSKVFMISSNERVYQSLDQSVPFINANDIWTIQINTENLTGTHQTVCVIDSGVNDTHPDLNNKVIAQHCFCAYGGGCCPPNNSVEGNDAEDGTGHGTHVSGIIVADGYLKGVAPGASIVVVKVFDSLGNGYIDDTTAAVEWCYNNSKKYNISIITMSLGASLYDDYCDSNYNTLTKNIESAINTGIFVDAAAGNGANFTHISSPACISNVTSVGATYDANVGEQDWCKTWNQDHTQCIEYLCNDTITFADRIACFSNRNSITSLFAPGAIINSTSYTGGYEERSGTSMAAPHVAGVAALMKQANSSLTPFDIRSIMQRTGVSVYDPLSKLTFPRIDAYRSVMASIHDLVVSDAEIFDSNNKYNLFSFNVFNDLNETINNINWSVSLGDGNIINNTADISIGAYDDLWVFIEHTYDNVGDYTVNVTANSTTDSSNWQSLLVTIDKDFGISDIDVLCTDCLGTRVFGFNITNYYTPITANWSIKLGDGNELSSTETINLNQYEDIWVFVEHDYDEIGNYTINSTATSEELTRYSNNAFANITQVLSENLKLLNLGIFNSTGLYRIFNFTIQNNGTQNQSGIYWQFNISGETPVNSNEINLTVNEEVWTFIEYTYPSAGSYTITAKADPDDLIQEFNENDNEETLND